MLLRRCVCSHPREGELRVHDVARDSVEQMLQRWMTEGRRTLRWCRRGVFEKTARRVCCQWSERPRRGCGGMWLGKPGGGRSSPWRIPVTTTDDGNRLPAMTTCVVRSVDYFHFLTSALRTTHYAPAVDPSPLNFCYRSNY